jgi:hypothetical protein
MLRSTAAILSKRQLVEAAVMASSRRSTSACPPRASRSAMAWVCGVLVRTCQNRPATRSIGSRVMSHW